MCYFSVGNNVLRIYETQVCVDLPFCRLHHTCFASFNKNVITFLLKDKNVITFLLKDKNVITFLLKDAKHEGHEGRHNLHPCLCLEPTACILNSYYPWWIRGGNTGLYCERSITVAQSTYLATAWPFSHS